MRIVSLSLLAGTAVAVLAGCGDDGRVSQVAREAANRQAEQNRIIAAQNERLTEAHKAIVEADAKARREALAMQREVQSQRSVPNQGIESGA